MISVSQKGDFSKTFKFLNRMERLFTKGVFDRYGREGVKALSDSTPVDTGLTAGSWYYTVEIGPSETVISWSNSNRNDGVQIAAILQYGHGTANGGYVTGIDYINPAIKPVFDKIVESLWKEVTR